MSKTFVRVAFCLLFGFLMFCLLFGAISWIAWAFTYEGELDPNEFTKWEFVDVKLVSALVATITIQNPDKSANIQRVQMSVYINSDGSGSLFGYRYFKQGEIYEYEISIDKKRYERRKYTGKEWRACLKCHILGSPV